MKVRKKMLAIVLSFSIVVSTMASSITAWAVPTANPDREAANAEVSREAAEEGITLLKNDNNLLPLGSQKVAVFGRGQEDTIKGGTGSGQVNNVYNVNIIDGLANAGVSYDEALASEYKEWVSTYPIGASGFTSPSSGYEWAIPLERVQETKDNGAETAVIVISRVSGEFADRTLAGRSATSGGQRYTTGDYYLSAEEVTMISNVAAVYENIVLLLNVGGVIDLNWINGIDTNDNGVGEVAATEKATGSTINTGLIDSINNLSVDVDSILYVSLAGQEGGNAIANVLTGETTPSGKLASTWAEDYADYPAGDQFGAVNNGENPDNRSSAVIYEEGIYVGYRYFDTFNVTPAYEFGYGLSYTTFKTVTDSVTRNGSEITVKATVTNTGDTYSGKEVVQVYYSAPEGSLGLEKAYQELVAYEKTDTLAPGESQTLTITFDLTDMTSYDEDSSAYVLEAGDYTIRVGNSSRNTSIEAVIDLRGTAVVSEVDNKLEISSYNDSVANWLSKEGVEPYSYETEDEEYNDAVTIRVTANVLSQVIETQYADYIGDAVEMTVADEDVDKTYTLVDVALENADLEQVIAQMSVEELAKAAVGASGSLNTGESAIGDDAITVAGAAGESTRFAKYFIPNFVMADGPAGIRITQSGTTNGESYEQNCTAFPIGTLLAMTWDYDTIYKVGKAIGEEMVEYDVDLWLAPGMNIHRDPLCGRNFEYYSEDPVLTGYCGIAATEGVQSNEGVGVTIKHYAMNQQETNRTNMDTAAQERVIREIYLKGFQMVVENADPYAIMTSYNDINGTPAADNADLCNDITRGEWNFNGLIMTDWGGGQSNAALSMYAGNDLRMPGGTANMNTIISGVNNGIITKADVQRSVYNILKTAMRMNAFLDQYALVINVDKTQLSDLVGQVNDLLESGTLKTNDTLATALDEAQTILDNEIDGVSGTANVYTQNQVDTKATELLEAAAGATATNKTYLQATVDYAETNAPDTLNELVKAKLDEALAEAKAILEDPFATQAEINESLSKLIDIIQMFDYTSDKSELQALVDLVEALDTSSLSSDLKEALESALEEAKSVLEDPTALDAQIQEVLTKLQDAYDDAFAYLSIDVSQLETMISLAETYEANLAKYKDGDAKDAFVAALAEARDMLTSRDSQEAVDDAANALFNAVLELRLIPDKSDLQALVVQAQALSLSNYTYESAQVLTVAVNSAIAVLENDAAEQEDVQNASKTLTTALTNLVLATTTEETNNGTKTEADGTSTDGTSTSDDSSSSDGTDSSSSSSTASSSSSAKASKVAKTGDNTPVFVIAALFGAAGILIVIKNRRMRSS